MEICGGGTREAKVSAVAARPSCPTARPCRAGACVVQHLRRTTRVGRRRCADRGVAAVERGVLQSHAAEIQRQGVQTGFEHVDGQRAVDFRPLTRRRDGVVGRYDQGGLRGVGFRRLLRLLRPVPHIPRGQARRARLVLQKDVQVGEGNVNFAAGIVPAEGRPRRQNMLSRQCKVQEIPQRQLASANWSLQIGHCKLASDHHSRGWQFAMTKDHLSMSKFVFLRIALPSFLAAVLGGSTGDEGGAASPAGVDRAGSAKDRPRAHGWPALPTVRTPDVGAGTPHTQPSRAPQRRTPPQPAHRVESASKTSAGTLRPEPNQSPPRRPPARGRKAERATIRAPRAP